MEKKNESVLDRKLRDCDFEQLAIIIKGGKRAKSLKYAELVENLVSQLKGKDVCAVVEIFSIILLLLDAEELVAIRRRSFEIILHRKLATELAKKAKEGNTTTHDVITAAMLKEILDRN